MKPGQSLIILLVFVSMSIIIASVAITLNVLNSTITYRTYESDMAYNVAESGLENALMRLLRNRSYTGETLVYGDGTVTTTITGSGPYTIASTARSGDTLRQLQVTANFVNGILTLTPASWQETY